MGLCLLSCHTRFMPGTVDLGPASEGTDDLVSPQAFFTLARDIKAKMDKKLVSVWPCWLPAGASLHLATSATVACRLPGRAQPDPAAPC